jgi:hypothetical protein
LYPVSFCDGFLYDDVTSGKSGCVETDAFAAAVAPSRGLVDHRAVLMEQPKGVSRGARRLVQLMEPWQEQEVRSLLETHGRDKFDALASKDADETAQCAPASQLRP